MLPSALGPFPFAPAPTDSNLLLAMSAQMPTQLIQAAQSQVALNQQHQGSDSNAPSPSLQKRARTRIGDDQIKILRQVGFWLLFLSNQWGVFAFSTST